LSVNFQLLQWLIYILTILVTLSHKFYENHQTKISDFIAIKSILLAGTVAIVLENYVLLGIEVLSIALYILCKQQIKFKSNEAGLLYGIFASGIILLVSA
jgi:NADH-quinone oxidoreductase subunit N